MAREDLEGVGHLEKWQHLGKKHAVRYRFTITTEIVERPGFPRVAPGRHGEGVVESTTGEYFPDGEYRLYAGGETFRVKNLGLGMWVILSS
jgi:hypothetical protein